MNEVLKVIITIDPFLLMFIVALWVITLSCLILMFLDFYFKSFTHYKRKIKRLQKYKEIKGLE